MEYRCVVTDPKLNNEVILEEESGCEFDSREDMLDRIGIEYSTMKPFLEKYGLIVEYLDETDEKIALDKLENPEDRWTEINVLPTWDDIAPTYKEWTKCYPWMRLDDFEGFPYPLYWQYSRPTREKKRKKN